MPEFDAHDAIGNSIEDVNGDPDELADAYAALDEDRRQQAELRSEPAQPPAGSYPAHEIRIETLSEHDATPATAEMPTPSVSPQPPTDAPGTRTAAEPAHRVFLIDGKDYPDPDTNLPITGSRSVQAMYRDYFPSQLDNVDVAQKTRADGTIEVTFKRRIGTKGASDQQKYLHSSGSGEVAVTVDGVVRVLVDLPADRPLVWDLVEQAIAPDRSVRLDYVPPAAELNLAEAQQAARVRLIELAVVELRRPRPNT
jgi:hypothetical protein